MILDPNQCYDYRNKLRIIRPRPEIDRVGSAWLIRKFVDPDASFVFANTPSETPEAIPYDMFEVEFSHHGDCCTFETFIEATGSSFPGEAETYFAHTLS